MSEEMELSRMREFGKGFRCLVCGHNKVWHYGEGGACEARVLPEDGEEDVYDYALLGKCGCPGPERVQKAGAAHEADCH